MYNCDDNSGYVRVDFTSSRDLADVLNVSSAVGSGVPRVQHIALMGGYRYPILEWFSDQLDGSAYQILKCDRPSEDEESKILESVLKDPNTLYSYPDGNKITIVQFENWDNEVRTLEDLGVDIQVAQKLFKRVKTFNRRFRAFASFDRPVRTLLIPDDLHTSYAEFVSEDDKQKFFDGAFVISPSVVAECMRPFDEGVSVFNEHETFATKDFNRNTEVGNYYRSSKVFNARIFGPIELINEGDPEDYAPFLGAIKGQAYVDHSGLCEHYGVDVIAPYSAFKPEVNIFTRSFFLIEPQSAKLGQMFSDGQTIANLPALYEWRDIKKYLNNYYRQQFDRLVNNEMLEQWSDMTFAMFDPERPKMFDSDDVAALTTWNVRSWMMCGGKLSHSPWLFAQMGKNFLASMRTDDDRKMRFPVPCAARALVITESLLRSLKGLYPENDNFFRVELGEARWDTDLNVLVVNDMDYIEMYPSHGGCDLDDFFQIYWRELDGEKVIIVVRSPNDWGEYSIFKYHSGDWYSKNDIGDNPSAFPVISSDPELWPKRLSEAIDDGDITYLGLPKVEAVETNGTYDADFVLAGIDQTSASAASVGVNVNARQLWAITMKSHRPVQVCSMEDAIDAGVQGGNELEVNAVIEEGKQIIAEILESGTPVDAFLWYAKHANFYPKENPELCFSNFSYLQKIRMDGAAWFKNAYTEYAEQIPHRVSYTKIHSLGNRYLPSAVNLLKWYRRSLYEQSVSIYNTPDWEHTADRVVEEIMKQPEGVFRNSYVLSLYSATLQVPLSSGIISDQFVMQPKIFPLLMEALQFFGLLGRLELNPNSNQLVRTYQQEWQIYNGKIVKFDNPLDFQTYYFDNFEQNTQKVASSAS